MKQGKASRINTRTLKEERQGIKGRLRPRQRLEIIDMLLGATACYRFPPSALPQTSPIVGKLHFDAIHIDVSNDEAESAFAVVMELLIGSATLPKAIAGYVKYNGNVAAVLQIDVSKWPGKGSSAVGLEGKASYYSLEDQTGLPPTSTHKTNGREKEGIALLFDNLLRLSKWAQEESLKTELSLKRKSDDAR